MINSAADGSQPFCGNFTYSKIVRCTENLTDIQKGLEYYEHFSNREFLR